jgi:hypothetical protein
MNQQSFGNQRHGTGIAHSRLSRQGGSHALVVADNMKASLPKPKPTADSNLM